MPRIERDIAQLKAEVAQRPLPRHVGIIMDGNGRWAEQRGLPRLEGHRRGSDSVGEVTRAARRLGLSALTLYAFSSQNWERPPEEVAGLMDLLRDYLHRERPEIMENDIRLHAIGELDRLPPRVREPLEDLRRDSARHGEMVLTLALSYGGRAEIVAMARQVAADRPAPEQIDAAAAEDRLWTAGAPPPALGAAEEEGSGGGGERGAAAGNRRDPRRGHRFGGRRGAGAAALRGRPGRGEHQGDPDRGADDRLRRRALLRGEAGERAA